MTKLTETFVLRLTPQARVMLDVAANEMGVSSGALARQCIAVVIDPENTIRESVKLMQQAAKGGKADVQ